VVQKVDTAKASSSKVNHSTLSPKDLVHLVDVSMDSKYIADLALLMWALAEDVCSMLDSFKHDLDDSLLRQVKCKQMADTTNASTL
jgi:hypothetical protein